MTKWPKLYFSFFIIFSLIAVSITAAVHACDYCKKPINESNWTEYDNRYFHIKHFLCSHCNKPIKASSFFEDDGKFFDSTCYNNQIAPSCNFCLKPLIGQWVTSERGAYHPKCYEENIALNCFVCNKVISGKYFMDGFGNSVCNEHHNYASRCHSCSKYLKQNEETAGQRYEDGRLNCKTCLNSAIMKKEPAKLLMDSTINLMSSLGIIITGKIKLKLVGQDELNASSHGYSGDQLGVTLYQKTSSFLGLVSRKNFEILVLYGLPRSKLREVLAHELMHVWLFKNGPDFHQDELCEGSCEYASYLVLKNTVSKESEALIERKLTNTDPIYGEGFRQVTEFVNETGIFNWLEYLKENSNPPW